MKNAPPLRRKRPMIGRSRFAAGGYVGHRKAMHEDYVAEQQVVHVAAMAGHVDDLVPLGHLLKRRAVTEFHAVVQTVPQARERTGHEAHEGVGIVCGDLQRIATRAQHCLAARQLRRPHFLSRGAPHRARVQDLVHQRAPVREVRPDARGATPCVHRSQAARDASPAHRHGKLGAQRLAQ